MILTAFQVEKFLDDIGQKVVVSIEDNYGKDDGFTSVWNSTMKEVRYYHAFNGHSC